MKNKEKILYPFLIFLIWLIVYLISNLILGKNFEWDECKYLACARGIAENLDFGSRSTTIEGLIKYGFPQHTTHYPLNSLYIAAFFKLFGVSLDVAYFSTWFSALVTCLFLYFILLLVTNNSYLFSFLLAISFLFFPSMIFHINSVMMEIPGCALICILVYLMFRDLQRGKVNIILFATAALFLYFYKSLFIGVVIGLIGLVKLTLFFGNKIGLEIRVKRPFLNFCLFVLIFVPVYFIFTKYIFLPLAPWIVFTHDQESSGAYADFVGGFFRDPLYNLTTNLGIFFKSVILHYYPFSIIYLENNEAFYDIIPPWIELAFYFLVFFYTVMFSVLFWKKLRPLQKIFILFAVFSIISFNLIFVTLCGGSIGPLWRYNLYYVPLLLISFGIILLEVIGYIKPFYLRHKGWFSLLIVSIFIFIYVPLYYSAFLVLRHDDNFYFTVAQKNSELIKNFIGNTNPAFVYFSGGSHITWNMYPVREVFMEATNDMIKNINRVLPKPIEYLFLSPGNFLFRQNQDLILRKEPIVDSWYTFYGVDPQNQVVVYRLNKVETK